MEEIPISRFKATCLAVLERVRRTGQPIRVTRFGKPVAEIVPSLASTEGKFKLGGLEGRLEIVGDIISPVVAPEEWEALAHEAPSGYPHMDLERSQTRTRGRQSPKGTRKR